MKNKKEYLKRLTIQDRLPNVDIDSFQGSLDDIIGKIERLKNTYTKYDQLRIQTYYDHYDDGGEIQFSLYGERQESDEEYDKRIKFIEKQILDEKMEKKAKKLAKEERDKKEYERLKAKFEKL